MTTDVVTVERVIPAPPEAIFALLADPSKHHLIDGSGTVKDACGPAPAHLSLGDTFGMSMKLGVPYRMANTVVELEEGRRIAWSPRMRGPFRFVGGRIWRYELEPVEGGTRVTETWDISRDLLKPVLRRGGMPERTRANMEKTLERIEELAGQAGRQ